jgi:hypothetical protein
MFDTDSTKPIRVERALPEQAQKGAVVLTLKRDRTLVSARWLALPDLANGNLTSRFGPPQRPDCGAGDAILNGEAADV